MGRGLLEIFVLSLSNLTPVPRPDLTLPLTRHISESGIIPLSFGKRKEMGIHDTQTPRVSFVKLPCRQFKVKVVVRNHKRINK